MYCKVTKRKQGFHNLYDGCSAPKLWYVDLYSIKKLFGGMVNRGDMAVHREMC